MGLTYRSWLLPRAFDLIQGCHNDWKILDDGTYTDIESENDELEE